MTTHSACPCLHSSTSWLDASGFAGMDDELRALRRAFRATRALPCAGIGLWTRDIDELADDGAALAQALTTLLPRRPVFFPPACPELSFDEAWLLRLLASHRAGDRSSFLFLLRSRLPEHALRPAARILGGFGRCLARGAA